MKKSLVMTDGRGTRVIEGPAVSDSVLRKIKEEIGDIEKTQSEKLRESARWRKIACSNLPARIINLVDYYCVFALSKEDILKEFKKYKHQWVGRKTILALEEWQPVAGLT